MSRFKGENPRIHSNSWWMQWAPGAKPQDQDAKESTGMIKDMGQTRSVPNLPQRQ